MNRTTNALIVLLSIPASALANDVEVMRCRGITDTAARLACYDAMVITQTEAVTVPNQPAVPAAQRPSPATPPPSIAALAPAQAKSDQFGLENRAAPGTLDAIESFIPGRFEGWDARSSIRLANGQVWQIADDSSRYLTMNDPKVKIRRGALGAFYLEFEKINHSPRVRRLQ